ncbi:MAG: hypothetical protein SAJ11_16610 [Jaaginema sp. PMC 1078.18]|nr:hypothetical protein [Jaaginema sp. PMC 1078.18]
MQTESNRLYAEVIQAIASRQMLWVRPLLLEIASQSQVYDLRQTSDLVWPQTLFQPALDTEAIPVLTQLQSLERKFQPHAIARQQLHIFLHQCWQAQQFNEPSSPSLTN